MTRHVRSASSPLALRPPVLWALACCLVLSAWALWWPDPVQDRARGNSAEFADAESGGLASARPPMASVVAGIKSQPESDGDWTGELQPLTLDVARFDPFTGMPPQPKAEPARAPPVAPATIQPVSPPVVTVPPVSYRYFGSMLNPAGALLVYLARGDVVVPVRAGTRLDDGFVVEAVLPNEVRLHYPALDVRRSVMISPAQENSAR